jgi:SAM-dependent methyltransferase
MGLEMPTLAENPRIGAVERDWSQEWSTPWGNAEAEWFHVIYPRIHRMIPAPTILEVGVGFGRWTQYLLPLCERLIGTDASSVCVDACKQRFPRGRFYANDDNALDMVRNETVDFIFSFDRLVHANAAVMRSYVKEFRRILTKKGRGFIHHSNLGAYGRLLQSGELKYPQDRDVTMSAELFHNFCEEAGLVCVGQELINWVHGEPPIDCLSIIAQRSGNYDKSYVRVENRDFMTEAHHVRLTQPLYEPSVNTQKK